ncbi:MAG: DUF2280 domain-containing protein [Bacteroidota bacterium]
MASLTDPQKRYLVQRLAVFDSPSEAADALFEEHGVRIDRRQAGNYDAEQPHARQRLAKSLVALFDETRERFTREVESIPIAQKAYRLRRLDENERQARRMRNLRLSNETLKQAAQEVGGAFEPDSGDNATDGLRDLLRAFDALDRDVDAS